MTKQFRNKRALRYSAILLVLGMITGVFAGCNSEENSNNSKVIDKGEITLPLKESMTLKYWCPFNGAASEVGMNSLVDSEMFKELEKRTNVKIEFQHPVVGQEKEQLNLILAANDLPDIIQNDLKGYSGGMAKAYEDGLIIDLKPYQDKYGPNIAKAYDVYPELIMNVSTEDGKFSTVPNIRADDSLLTFYGLQTREDWLDKVGLQVPTTIDEIETMLKAYKEKLGVETPYSDKIANINTSMMAGAFGVNSGLMVDNGKVIYGAADQRYKEFLKTMAKWYSEGLLDSEFAVNNDQILTSKVINGKTGLYAQSVGSGIKKFLSLSKEKDFDLVGIPYPTLKKGEQSKFINRVNPAMPCLFITSANKYPAETMKWIDYGFTKEGHMLNNFGIEGVSYTMEKGYPKYTDLITKNPDGKSMASIAYKYMLSVNSGAFVQDARYGEQYFDMPQQREAMKTWGSHNVYALKQNTDMYGNLTPDELGSIASKETEINTYRDEMFLKFVMGQESLDNFDTYVKNINNLGLKNVLETRQVAYDRFIQHFPQALNREAISFDKFGYKE